MNNLERLKTDPMFEPFLAYKNTSRDQVLADVKSILNNESALNEIMAKDLSRQNLFSLINYVYLLALNDPSRLKKQSVQKSVFDEKTTKKIYHLAEQL